MIKSKILLRSKKLKDVYEMENLEWKLECYVTRRISDQLWFTVLLLKSKLNHLACVRQYFFLPPTFTSSSFAAPQDTSMQSIQFESPLNFWTVYSGLCKRIKLCTCALFDLYVRRVCKRLRPGFEMAWGVIIWPTDPKFSAFKDLNLFFNYVESSRG